jgi:hypothetical protein
MLTCRECFVNFVIDYIVIDQNFFSLSGIIAFGYKIILALLRESYKSRIFCKKKINTIDWLEVKKAVFICITRFFRASQMFCYPLTHCLAHAYVTELSGVFRRNSDPRTH